LAIGKRDDSYLRILLVHGARVALRMVVRKARDGLTQRDLTTMWLWSRSPMIENLKPILE
jgi:hypothetical protein